MIAAAHTVTVRPAAALSARRGYVSPPHARPGSAAAAPAAMK
jgi:hypothetical protein